VQPTAGDDILMDDIPLAPFEEAEGDDAYADAIKEAFADHRCVLATSIRQYVFDV
jgi:hypothetical protein